ncbi:MAG: DUF2064 domain-containing protein [Luteimonas sp.]|nr:DUF2064 domain-containing protein [Luteimonas sp.]
MNGALAIFVKTPGRSAVKSRLAAACGEAHAQQWYRHAAAAVASVALRARALHGLVAYWAVAEAGAEAQWPGLPALPQGKGDLGTRMARVHAALVARHGFGLLVGADAPQLDAQALGEAAAWLGDPDCNAGDDDAPAARLALGPASDGGFWLFGANRAIPADAWTRVPYSDAGTAHALRQSMQAFGAWKELRELTDVDHVEDLAVVQQALEALPDPTDEQRALAQWMRTSARACA